MLVASIKKAPLIGQLLFQVREARTPDEVERIREGTL